MNTSVNPAYKSRKTLLVIIGFCTLLISIGVFFFYSDFFSEKTALDISDKENSKIVPMFNEQIEYQIDEHTRGDMNPGYSICSRQATVAYLQTIACLESTSRFGVASVKSRNYLELKITFTNGKITEKVYTGTSCSGYYGPCLLMKVYINKGKAYRVFTNGTERKGSPNNIVNDMNVLIESAISYDIDRNHSLYFKPEKTQKDFDKEWENKSSL